MSQKEVAHLLLHTHMQKNLGYPILAILAIPCKYKIHDTATKYKMQIQNMGIEIANLISIARESFLENTRGGWV